MGGLLLKGRAWTASRFKGGLGKKEGVGVFEGVDTPMHRMSMRVSISFNG